MHLQFHILKLTHQLASCMSKCELHFLGLVFLEPVFFLMEPKMTHLWRVSFNELALDSLLGPVLNHYLM